jgi:replication-associated recombination protein RarA
MADRGRDPWTQVRTRHDFPADEIISTLQKEIRRGNEENAALVAYEMITTSAELDAYLWRRLQIISVEDIGFGDPWAPVIVAQLHRIRKSLGPEAGERILFAIHAVRYLCSRPKDRSSDEMAMWIKRAVESDEQLPQIPDYALDMHTRRGQEMGRDIHHFLSEAARLDPEMPDRDKTYRERLIVLLSDRD